MNQDINDTQCTVLWHVDDLKISHRDSSVVSTILHELDDWYGDHMPLTIMRGKVHDYLGMKIDFSSRKKVIFPWLTTLGMS